MELVSVCISMGYGMTSFAWFRLIVIDGPIPIQLYDNDSLWMKLVLTLEEFPSVALLLVVES